MSETADAPVLDDEHPWPGLGAFTEASGRFFFGRSHEEEELISRVRREPTTLLFGQSGLGKTSLLQAAMLPRLREEGYLPVLVRLDHSSGAPPLGEQVKALITQAIQANTIQAPIPGAAESLWDYLHRRDLKMVSPRGRELAIAIVLDQFEELFTLGLGRPDRRAGCQAFLLELADLIEHRLPTPLRERIEKEPELAERYAFGRDDYRIVLAMREDYLPYLESLRTRAPSLGRNRLRLTRMNGRQAMEAVSEPGRGLVSDDVAQGIVSFLGRGRSDDPFGVMDREADEALAGLQVQPALLSLFCRELNEERIAAGQPCITTELLAEKQQGILERFYERAFAGQPLEARAFVEDELLTEDGHRDSRTVESAIRWLDERGVPASALNELVNRRILHVEERLEVSRVELIHDVLTDIAIKSRNERRIHQAAAEQNRAAEKALEEAAKREAALRETFARRRNGFLAVAGVSAAVLAAVIAVLAVYNVRTRAENELTLAANASLLQKNTQLALQASEQNRESLHQYFELVLEGEAAANSAAYGPAIDDFTKAIQLRSDHAEAYIARGNAEREVGDAAGASRDFNLAIGAEATAQGYATRGQFESDGGQYPAAIADYDTAVKLEPDYAAAYNGRGDVYAKMRNYDLAVQDYTKATSLAPNYARAFGSRGAVYRQMHRTAKAEADLRTSIRLDATVADTFKELGDAYADDARYEDAIKQFDEALRIGPAQGDVLLDRARVEQLKGDQADADADSAAAQRLGLVPQAPLPARAR